MEEKQRELTIRLNKQTKHFKQKETDWRSEIEVCAHVGLLSVLVELLRQSVHVGLLTAHVGLLSVCAFWITDYTCTHHINSCTALFTYI